MFAEKLKNKLGAITQKIIPVVPEETQKERMSICLSCEHFVRITKQCKKCGCFLEAKTRLANSSCPIKKWPIYTNETA